MSLMRLARCASGGGPSKWNLPIGYRASIILLPLRSISIKIRLTGQLVRCRFLQLIDGGNVLRLRVLGAALRPARRGRSSSRSITRILYPNPLASLSLGRAGGPPLHLHSGYCQLFSEGLYSKRSEGS